jgi:hypothetical protein
MSFYVYLPSNSSSSYFPENTMDNYKTKLTRKIDFGKDDYEVALTEINYFNVYNVFSEEDEKERTVTIAFQREKRPEGGIVTSSDLLIPNIAYSNPLEIVHCLNEMIKGKTSEISIWVDKISQRTKINLARFTTIQMSSKLMSILGYKKKGFFRPGEHTAVNPLELGFGNYFYIYSDIVSQQYVGDTMSPLLRILHNTTASRHFTSVSFRPYYKAVSRREFDTIEVLIRNEFGEKLKFSDGPTTLTLHFRARGSQDRSG